MLCHKSLNCFQRTFIVIWHYRKYTEMNWTTESHKLSIQHLLSMSGRQCQKYKYSAQMDIIHEGVNTTGVVSFQLSERVDCDETPVVHLSIIYTAYPVKESQGAEANPSCH